MPLSRMQFFYYIIELNELYYELRVKFFHQNIMHRKKFAVVAGNVYLL